MMNISKLKKQIDKICEDDEFDFKYFEKLLKEEIIQTIQKKVMPRGS